MITLMSTIMIILSTQLYAGAMPIGIIAGSVTASTAAQNARHAEEERHRKLAADEASKEIMPADGMIECRDVMISECCVERFQGGGCSSDNHCVKELTFKDYAQSKLGFEIEVVGISYESYHRRMHIYFRRIK